MYYHGTRREGKYTFWVYPDYNINKGLTLQNKWDTIIPADKYCNNHLSEGLALDNPYLKQYVCRGHESLEDMAVAQDDWCVRGFDMEVENMVEPEPAVDVRPNRLFYVFFIAYILYVMYCVSLSVDLSSDRGLDL